MEKPALVSIGSIQDYPEMVFVKKAGVGELVFPDKTFAVFLGNLIGRFVLFYCGTGSRLPLVRAATSEFLLKFGINQVAGGLAYRFVELLYLLSRHLIAVKKNDSFIPFGRGTEWIDSFVADTFFIQKRVMPREFWRRQTCVLTSATIGALDSLVLRPCLYPQQAHNHNLLRAIHFVHPGVLSVDDSFELKEMSGFGGEPELVEALPFVAALSDQVSKLFGDRSLMTPSESCFEDAEGVI